MTEPYSSSNLVKYTHANPLQRWLIHRFQEQLLTLLPHGPVARGLDAGCGEGMTLQLIDHRRPDLHLVGFEASREALLVARRVSTAAVAQGYLQALPYADDAFDLVICTEVLEHLPDPGVGLRELRRVTDGRLVLSVPNEPFFRGANFLRGKNWGRWGSDSDHRQHWTAAAFAAFVRSNGCRILQLRTSFPWTLVLAEPV